MLIWIWIRQYTYFSKNGRIFLISKMINLRAKHVLNTFRLKMLIARLNFFGNIHFLFSYYLDKHT